MGKFETKFNFNDAVYIIEKYPNLTDIYDISDADEIIYECIKERHIRKIEFIMDVNSGKPAPIYNNEFDDTNTFSTKSEAYKFIVKRLLNDVLEIKNTLEVLLNPPVELINKINEA